MLHPIFCGFIPNVTPNQVRKPADLPISDYKPPIFQGSASESHIVLLDSDGIAFSSGSNDRGQLGIGSTTNTSTFAKVQSSESFAYVSCGDGFTIWLSEKGKLFASGINNFQQPQLLDAFDALQCSSYQKTAAIITNNKTVILWPDFTNNNSYKEFSLPHPAIHISCGLNFVSVLLENQTLFRIYTDGTIEPMVIRPSNDSSPIDRFVKISSAENYTVAIDFRSQLWIFGPVGRYQPGPISTPLFSGAIDVFAFPNSVIAITTENSIYAFGENADGNLALNDLQFTYEFEKTQIDTPVLSIIGNSRTNIYLKRPITREFVDFDRSHILPGNSKFMNGKVFELA